MVASGRVGFVPSTEVRLQRTRTLALFRAFGACPQVSGCIRWSLVPKLGLGTHFPEAPASDMPVKMAPAERVAYDAPDWDVQAEFSSTEAGASGTGIPKPEFGDEEKSLVRCSEFSRTAH